MKLQSKSLIILTSLLLIILISGLIMINAEAAVTDCALCGGDHPEDITNFFCMWTYNMKCRVYGGDIVPDSIMTILKFDLSDSASAFSSMNSLVSRAYGVFAHIGTLLMVVLVLYDLFGKLATEELSAENLLLGFLKLLIGVVIVNNGKDILFYGISVMNQIFDRVMSVGVGNPSTEGFYDDTCEYFKFLKSNYMWQALLDGAFIFIPWLISFFTGAVIAISCWSRVLEITVRIIFAPIGMADMITEGTGSSGWGYFKKLLASVLKGAMVLMTLRCFGIVTELTRNMNALLAWIMPIILSIVVIGLIFKTSSIADDIIGT